LITFEGGSAMSKIGAKGAKALGQSLRSEQAARREPPKTAAILKLVKELGADETLIVRKKGVAVRVEKVRTKLRFPEIRKALEHAPASGRGELAEEEKQALDAGGFDRAPLVPGVQDPVARAASEYAKLREESLSAAEAARLLGVEASRIRQRLGGKAPTLFGIKVDGDWRLPRFQFVQKARVPGIEKVIPRLRVGLNPVGVVRWFNAPNADLRVGDDEERSLSPLEWLKTGHDPAIVAGLAAEL
jgi:hypothetical protein